ncbi:MAG: Stp1/IreP family PP2C-type Ser/Thr phosphatase [Candidatus Eisenbacteria bacterium]
MTVEIEYGAASDTGQVRSRNEDSYLVWMPEAPDKDPRAVFLVADGMGGHEAGDVASRFVVAELERAIAGGQTFSEQQFDERMRRWFSGVSRSLVHLAESRGASRGMGSTASLVVLIGRRLVLGHVGDSRIYRWRKGALEQLSLDHSFAEEQRRRGLLTAEEALHHPQRNLLTQALGVDTELDVQTAELDWQSGDRFLLCSDGLHGPVAMQEIAERMDERHTPQEAADALVAKANEAGGPDNITAVIFELHGEGAPEPILAGGPGQLMDDDAPTDPSPFAGDDLLDTDPRGSWAEVEGATTSGAAKGRPPGWAWVVLAIAVLVAAVLLFSALRS